MCSVSTLVDVNTLNFGRAGPQHLPRKATPGPCDTSGGQAKMSELCNEYMNPYEFLQIHENPNSNELLQIHEIPARLKQAPVFDYFPARLKAGSCFDDFLILKV